MPKIEVYKGNRIMIPVSEAKKAKAYQCPWTDKIYATKRDYVKHLKDLREQRMHTRAREIVRQKIKNTLWTQPTFDDIINWFSTHPEFLFNRIMHHQWHDRLKYFEKYRDTFMMEITYLDVVWSESCMNTHNCPHNGVTNWGGTKVLADGTPAPRGYAGWRGNIEFKINCDMSEGSRVLQELRIHTGSGGARNGGKYGYDVIFFADDWPNLFKTHKEILAEDAINDNKKVQYNYKYGTADYFKW
jgi:hypothetical protein